MPSSRFLCQPHQFSNLSVNVYCRSDINYTDAVFSNTPAFSNGAIAAQLWVDCSFKFSTIYFLSGLTKKHLLITTYDRIRNHDTTMKCHYK